MFIFFRRAILSISMIGACNQVLALNKQECQKLIQPQELKEMSIKEILELSDKNFERISQELLQLAAIYDSENSRISNVSKNNAIVLISEILNELIDMGSINKFCLNQRLDIHSKTIAQGTLNNIKKLLVQLQRQGENLDSILESRGEILLKTEETKKANFIGFVSTQDSENKIGESSQGFSIETNKGLADEDRLVSKNPIGFIWGTPEGPGTSLGYFGFLGKPTDVNEKVKPLESIGFKQNGKVDVGYLLVLKLDTLTWTYKVEKPGRIGF